MNGKLSDFLNNLESLIFDNYITYEEINRGYCLEKGNKQLINHLSKEFRIKKSVLNEGIFLND
jgi:hypothetical protein